MSAAILETKPGQIRLVLVEDYALVRLGLRTTLNNKPLLSVVGEAGTGEEGLEMVGRLKPDVVLLDLGLPGISGIEVAKQIKAFDENIKVIILTSHEAEEEVVAALSAGANAYCLKEIADERLIEVIQSVYEGAAWLDPAIASIAFEIFSNPLPKTTESNKTHNLTERELQTLKLLVDGKSNSEIAAELCVSIHTAKAHVCSILQKLAVSDRVQAAVKAVKEAIVHI
jgi:DNA-binding NarL/FixJ family response regulator